MRRNRRQIEQAINWLLNSGIQAPTGGFHGWYDIETRSYPFLYAEATAYAISLLVKLDRIEQADQAATWLLNKSYWKDQAFRSHYYPEEAGFRPAMYSFDNAVCLKALLDIYRVTKTHRYLDFSWRIGDWLLRMQEPNGRFKALFPPTADQGWSVQPGCYHAKNALALLDLAWTVKEPQYEGAARRVCEWTLKRQLDNGGFPVKKLHPICYAAEGLLGVGRKLGDPRFVEAAEKAVSYLLKQKIKRPDVLAQTAILTSEFDLACTDILIHDLLKRQFRSNDKRADGGFLFNEKHVNSWTTIFAVEALQKWCIL